mgnify:CR=1 FL=1
MYFNYTPTNKKMDYPYNLIYDTVSDMKILNSIKENENNISEKVDHILDTLPDYMQEVLKYRYIHKMDNNEISKVLNISAECVRQRVMLGVSALKHPRVSGFFYEIAYR